MSTDRTGAGGVTRVVTPAGRRAARAEAIAGHVRAVPGVAALSPGARGTTHTGNGDGRIDGVRVDVDAVHVAVVAAAPDRRVSLPALADAVRAAVGRADGLPVHVEIADITDTEEHHP